MISAFILSFLIVEMIVVMRNLLSQNKPNNYIRKLERWSGRNKPNDKDKVYT